MVYLTSPEIKSLPCFKYFPGMITKSSIKPNNFNKIMSICKIKIDRLLGVRKNAQNIPHSSLKNCNSTKANIK